MSCVPPNNTLLGPDDDDNIDTKTMLSALKVSSTSPVILFENLALSVERTLPINSLHLLIFIATCIFQISNHFCGHFSRFYFILFFLDYALIIVEDFLSHDIIS